MDMEREDFLPFCRRQIQQIQQIQEGLHRRILARHESIIRLGISQPVFTVDQLRRVVDNEWYNRAVDGFLAHHFPLGHTVLIAGVPVFVKESEPRVSNGWQHPGHVTVLVKVRGDCLDEIRLPLDLLKAKVWTKFGLEPLP